MNTAIKFDNPEDEEKFNKLLTKAHLKAIYKILWSKVKLFMRLKRNISYNYYKYQSKLLRKKYKKVLTSKKIRVII